MTAGCARGADYVLFTQLYLDNPLLHCWPVHKPHGPVLLALSLRPGGGKHDLVVGEALRPQDPPNRDPSPGAELERHPGLDDELPGVLDQDVILNKVGGV